MQDKFRKYIVLSLLVHFLIFAILWLDPSFEKKIGKTYKVTFVQLSKGDGGTSLSASFKNAKNLPTSTLREQKKALLHKSRSKKGSDLRTHESQTKKSVIQKWSEKRTSDKGGINIKKTKKPVKKTRISDALARIDQRLDQRKVKIEASQTKTTGESGQSEFGGAKGTRVDPALVQYYNTIKRKINREWVVSKSEFSGPLRTKIVVMIDARGNILRSRFKRGSGNGSFDASAMRAVRRSAPFPSPPSSIRNEALSEGFLIEFNPNSVTGRI